MVETSEIPNPVLLEVSKVSKSFGTNAILKELSFQGKAGEVIGLLGPNGVGKTTTLRMIVGTLGLSAGVIKINNICMKNQPRQAKKNIGYLPETPPLYADLSVKEHLSFAGALRGLSGRAKGHSISQLMGQCRLESVKHQLIRNLSKGYRQRVALALALIGDPCVLVLDEPTSGLDLEQIEQMRTLIRELAKNKLIIFSTHLLQEVVHNCNRVLMLSQGELKKDMLLSKLQTDDVSRQLEVLIQEQIALEVSPA